jgi:hypothetical protein
MGREDLHGRALPKNLLKEPDSFALILDEHGCASVLSEEGVAGYESSCSNVGSDAPYTSTTVGRSPPVAQSFARAATPVGADASQGMTNFDPDVLLLMFGTDRTTGFDNGRVERTSSDKAGCCLGLRDTGATRRRLLTFHNNNGISAGHLPRFETISS